MKQAVVVGDLVLYGQDPSTSRDLDQVQSTVDFESLEELGSVTKRSIRLFFVGSQRRCLATVQAERCSWGMAPTRRACVGENEPESWPWKWF